MKLSEKVISWVAVGVLLIFLTTAFVTFCIERHFYRQQLSRSAQNIAISLNLSLSNPLVQNDRKLLLSIVNTMFSQESLALLEVRTTNGRILVSESRGVQNQFAPNWYVKLIQWPALIQSIDVMSGPTPVGELLVSSDPGYAYDALWNTFVLLFFCFLFWVVVLVTLVYYRVAWILTPLQRMIKQLNALGQREYLLERHPSSIREIQQVNLAINASVEALKQSSMKQIACMENVRYPLFRDPITGFGNQRYFLYQLSSLYYRDEDYVPGFILSILIEGFDEYKNAHESHECDRFLQEIALFAEEFWQNYPDLIITHYEEGYFALIIKENDASFLMKQCDLFNEQLRRHLTQKSTCQALLGLISYDAYHDKTMLLSEMEHTLMKAKTEPNQLFFSHNIETHRQLDVTMEELESSLDQEIEYIEQLPVTNGDKELHKEILLEIPIKETLVHSAYLMPMARRGGLARKLDHFVLDQLCQKELLGGEPIAFTLSDVTLADELLLADYLNKLKELPAANRSQLTIEVNELYVVKYFAQVVGFFNELNQLGIKLGVKQVGIYYEKMEYLNELPLSYLKLHGSLSHANSVAEKEFVLHYLSELASSLGIQLIATELQNEKESVAMQHLGIAWGKRSKLNNGVVAEV
jgi:EAL domain-containing protein (putative c-di-GMP-specific phosphodiesterase class I)/GGDEF domain-containing protein